MGLGLGLREKYRRASGEFRIRWANAFGRPNLYRRGSAERLGAIYTHPSDMCPADRIMLYALIRGLRPRRMVEIGVRWGGGARIIAAALEDAGGEGKAIGIDPETKVFRPKPRELFGRYELLTGFSPQAIPEAVRRLGGPLDLAIIDAVHTHDHVLADFRGVAGHMAPGGHVLLHDTFHMGIDQAAVVMLNDHPDFVDCGFLTRHPQIGDAPVAYQGLRLIRAGTLSSRQIITDAYERAGRTAPAFSPELYNWDYFWNQIKDNSPADQGDASSSAPQAPADKAASGS